MCVYERGSESRQSWGALGPPSAAQPSIFHKPRVPFCLKTCGTSPGCLCAAFTASPPPPLRCLSRLTATLCSSLCFSWSARLSAEGSSLVPLREGGRGRAEGARLGLSGRLVPSPSRSAFDSICLFVLLLRRAGRGGVWASVLAAASPSAHVFSFFFF